MTLNIVEKIDGSVKVRHVIASVSDKKGLDKLIPGLVSINPGVMIYSTGGTYASIQKILGDQAAKNLTSISDYTGQPEMQGGLVKTLDFKIYLGLLSETYNEAHTQDIRRVKGVAFDMVVVNLYPFKETVAKAGVTPEQARTNIDIGGPCMVRASAKNFIRVASVTDPADYDRILDELRKSRGCLSLKTRFELAKKAFAHTAEYDTAISRYLAGRKLAEIESGYHVQ
jgi:phosphoribosylaminoimidazolecarboxamide formyltransferase/IMP cyclohydrolase